MFNLIRFVLSRAGRKSKEISFYDSVIECQFSFTLILRKSASRWINFSFCCPKVHVCVCVSVTTSSPSFNHVKVKLSPCQNVACLRSFTVGRRWHFFFNTKHPFYSPVHLFGSADSFMNYKYLLRTLTWIGLSINRTNLQTYPLCVFLCVSEVYNFVLLFLSCHESA